MRSATEHEFVYARAHARCEDPCPLAGDNAGMEVATTGPTHELFPVLITKNRSFNQYSSSSERTFEILLVAPHRCSLSHAQCEISVS
jgi:hypothetical protein